MNITLLAAITGYVVGVLSAAAAVVTRAYKLCRRCEALTWCWDLGCVADDHTCPKCSNRVTAEDLRPPRRRKEKP